MRRLLFDLVKVGNVGVLVAGTVDAMSWSQIPQALDVPCMSYGTAVTLLGTYTGLVPEGMTPGDEFEFKLTFSGHELIS